MAVFENTRPHAAAYTNVVSRFATNLVSAVSDWNDARLTRKSLSKLTARELDDIGLTAADIETVARRSTYY